MLYNKIFFYVSVLFYFTGIAYYAAYLRKKEPALLGFSRQWIGVGLIAAAFFFFIRYRELSFLPLVTLFEITFFYAALTSAVYLLFIKEKAGAFINGMCLFIMAGILFLDLFLNKELHLLNPLLNSFWLGIHVPAAMLSYSAFALSFAVSVYYLIIVNRGSDASYLIQLNNALILIGVILLGIGIGTGSIWARAAWGTYWSWDPKETWALITFIIYVFASIISKIYREKAKLQSIVAIAGFLAMLFTFFGVSLVLVSHHSYK